MAISVLATLKALGISHSNNSELTRPPGSWKMSSLDLSVEGETSEHLNIAVLEKKLHNASWSWK